jgi:hypothetical protein
MLFRIGGRHGWGGNREFVNDEDGQAFLERKLMGFGVKGAGRSELISRLV